MRKGAVTPPPPLSDVRQSTFCHSSGDVFEAVPAAGMKRAVRFHAFLFEQVDQAPESLVAATKGTPYQSRLRACG